MIGFLAQPLVKWGAIATIILGLIAAVWVQSARLSGARAARDAAVQALDLIIQDRDRQVAALVSRDKVIAEQAMQLERHRADEAKVRQLAAQLDAEREVQLIKLKSDLASLKEKARANPDQVRPLGPIVLDTLRLR